MMNSSHAAGNYPHSDDASYRSSSPSKNLQEVAPEHPGKSNEAESSTNRHQSQDLRAWADFRELHYRSMGGMKQNDCIAQAFLLFL